MAKRPSDLGTDENINSDWVIEADAPTGAGEVIETRKVSLSEAYDIVKPIETSWGSSQPTNGWSGEVRSRVTNDGYLEIFISVNALNATSDVVATLSTPSRLDYQINKIYAYITIGEDDIHIPIAVSINGDISIKNVLGLPITITDYFKYIRLKP